MGTFANQIIYNHLQNQTQWFTAHRPEELLPKSTQHENFCINFNTYCYVWKHKLEKMNITTKLWCSFVVLLTARGRFRGNLTIFLLLLCYFSVDRYIMMCIQFASYFLYLSLLPENREKMNIYSSYFSRIKVNIIFFCILSNQHMIKPKNVQFLFTIFFFTFYKIFITCQFKCCTYHMLFLFAGLIEYNFHCFRKAIHEVFEVGTTTPGAVQNPASSSSNSLACLKYAALNGSAI